MTNMKSRIAQIVKIFGVMALVAAFAATAFPANTFASTAREDAYGKAVISVVTAGAGINAGLQPVAGASIELSNGAGVAVAKFATDSTGKVDFAQREGTYKIVVSASGMQKAGAYLVIKNGQTTNITVQLYPVNPSSISNPSSSVDPTPTPR